MSHWPEEMLQDEPECERREARQRRGVASGPWKGALFGACWIALVGALVFAGWLHAGLAVTFVALAAWPIADEFRGAKADRDKQAAEARYEAILERLRQQEAKVAQFEAELAEHKRRLRQLRKDQGRIWGRN